MSIVLSNVAMAKDLTNNKELNKYLDPILTETYYIQNILNDLNIFARLNNQIFQIQKEEILILPFVRQIIIQILNQEIWENVDISFHPNQSIENTYVKIDKFLFSRVIHNIIYNSILHNPSGCKIDISLSKVDEKIYLTILDNGIGVKPEQLHQLNSLDEKNFDIAFIRTTGIGLYISKRIIQLNQGELKISSKYKQFFKVEIII
ncbi:sensor histidine kinase [Enterococcus cecorum]|uniref:sensor histidine kinase n=1 Tax=Enterococcus cecorum TaxID=44008 RepID=UPI003B43313E